MEYFFFSTVILVSCREQSDKPSGIVLSSQRSGDQLMLMNNLTITKTIIALTLLAVGGYAFAQQPPERPSRPVDPAERAMERRAEQAVRQAERVERLLPDVAQQAQDKAIQALENRLQHIPEHAAQARLRPPLPPQLDIVNQRGEAQFREIEIEPFIRVVQQEWVLLASERELEALQATGNPISNYITEQQALGSLNQHLLTLHVPDNLDSQAALEALIPEPMRARLDRQHVYQLQALPSAARTAMSHELNAVCERPLKVGIIDTELNDSLPVFQDAVDNNRIYQRHFIEDSKSPYSSHGTALAALLIGQSPDRLNALLPDASLYQAAVFYQQDTHHHGSRTADLLKGLDWLHSEHIDVINMSFAGPPNSLLSMVIDELNASGITLVASVGNQGPHAPPQFPAAYDDVIAVTAVDKQGALYPWAVRGEHVDFSALGVDMDLPGKNGTWALQSGTSLAAPVVSAFAACFKQASTTQTRDYLKQHALPTAERAQQRNFGYGLLHPAAPGTR